MSIDGIGFGSGNQIVSQLGSIENALLNGSLKDGLNQNTQALEKRKQILLGQLDTLTKNEQVYKVDLPKRTLVDPAIKTFQILQSISGGSS